MKHAVLSTIGHVLLQASLAYALNVGSPDAANPFPLPPQSVLVEPNSFAVLGENATFRNLSFSQFLNPTLSTPPFFQIFDKSFLSILGSDPSIHQVTANFPIPLAFEAPIYNPATDEVFFCGNETGLLSNNQFSKISMKAVEAALAANPHASSVSVPITALNLSESIQIINGGAGPFKGSLVLVTNGRGSRPPVLALVNPLSPNNSTILLDNFFGRQFNSLDDVKVHPNGNIFFTDPFYGFITGARPAPLMPPQVYRFDPITSSVRVVVSDIPTPNGIAFTADGKTAYVSDTSSLGATMDTTKAATIYAYDVDPETDMFTNRRTFVYTDTGIPDGIQVDIQGNVYAGCGDGVQVWNSKGTLLGKFFIGSNTANMAFAGDGRLMIMAGTRIFLAKIVAKPIPSL